jgi:hypothetical protein
MIWRSFVHGRSGANEWRTADPSPFPDFLSRVAASINYMWFSPWENHMRGRR